jgi:hypothetical protein
MDGAGVAETGPLADIVERQPDSRLTAVVPDREVTAPADAGDGPPVAVLHPVGRGESESAVVGPGDDHISDAGLVPVSQVHLSSGRDVAEAMITGLTVQVGDKLPGGGEHDRVQSGSSVRNPSAEGILGGFGEVSDMDPAVSEVEVERRWFAVAEGERCCCFSGVGEAVQLGEMQRAVGVFDVAEDTAGADRGELLIITDQPDTGTSIDGELDGRVEGDGVGHAGFVDDHQC